MLDSNIIIALTMNDDIGVVRRAADCLEGEMVTSAIAIAEVAYGSMRGKTPAFAQLRAFVEEVPVLSFDFKAAEAYATLPFRRRSYDRLIGAHALSQNLVLVTDNEADFADIPSFKDRKLVELTDAQLLEQVIALAGRHTGIRNVTPEMAVDQDLELCGDDVREFVDLLNGQFGDWVLEWPWHRFACLDEGLSLLSPIALFWQLLTWPFRGSFSGPSPYERLELQHIAKVLAQGHWTDP